MNRITTTDCVAHIILVITNIAVQRSQKKIDHQRNRLFLVGYAIHPIQAIHLINTNHNTMSKAMEM